MNKTAESIKRLREKSTFKIELNLDTPLYNNSNISSYVQSVLEEIMQNLTSEKTYGLINHTDVNAENIIEGSWSLDIEEEYDPYYED